MQAQRVATRPVLDATSQGCGVCSQKTMDKMGESAIRTDLLSQSMRENYDSLGVEDYYLQVPPFLCARRLSPLRQTPPYLTMRLSYAGRSQLPQSS